MPAFGELGQPSQRLAIAGLRPPGPALTLLQEPLPIDDGNPLEVSSTALVVLSQTAVQAHEGVGCTELAIREPSDGGSEVTGVSALRRVSSRESFKSHAVSENSDNEDLVEGKAPTHLGKLACFDWKMRQLNLTTALKNRKSGVGRGQPARDTKKMLKQWAKVR